MQGWRSVLQKYHLACGVVFVLFVVSVSEMDKR